jgi:hypothetical protein
MANEFQMGARITLEDDFSNPIRDAMQATQQFREAMEGADHSAGDLQREMRSISTTQAQAAQAMGRAADNADEMADEMRTLATNSNRAEQEIRDVNTAARNTGGALSGLKSAVAGVATAVGGFIAVNKMKDFALGAIEAAASMGAMNAQFDAVFEGVEANATAALSKIANETNVVEGRLKGSFLQMAAFAKTTGMDTATALSLTERATLAAADSAAFYDRSIESTAESLQSFLKGNYENDAALGISATETTRNAAAMKEFGKKFKDLSEQQKQFTLLAMVEDGNKLSGALGQAAREGTAYENVMGNMKQAMTDFKVAVGGPLLQPFIDGLLAVTQHLRQVDTEKLVAKIERAKDVVSTLYNTFMSLVYDTGEVSDLWVKLGVPQDVADKIEYVGNLLRTGIVTGIDVAKDAFEGFKTTIGFVRDNMDTIIPIAGGLLAAIVAFKTMSTAVALFKAAKTALLGYKAAMVASTFVTQGFNAAVKANPIMALATAFGLLVAAGIYVYKNWDELKAQFLVIWGAISTFFAQTWANLKLGFNTFVTEISALWSSFTGWVSAQTTAFLAKLQAGWDFAWSYLKMPVEFFASYVSMVVSNFVAIVQGLFNAGMALIRGDWEGAWTAIKGIGETILNNIREFMAGFDLFEIGRNIIQGLINGIGDMAGAAVNKVREVAGGIKDAVTGFFGIHSPSRLFRTDVGQQLGAGMILGMNDSIAGVTAAATGMSEAATVNMSPTYGAGTTVPASGSFGTQTNSSNSIVIQKMIEKIELHATADTNVEELVQQIIAILYEKLRNASDILGGGQKGALL